MTTEFIISILFSAAAFIVSCASVWYCRRNFKMSRYEFNKRRKEETQAVLKAEAVKTIHGYTFVITNDGIAQARNIVCSFPKDEFSDFTIFGSKTFPLLDSGKSFLIKASACEGKNEHPTFIVTWEDDFSKTNSKKLTLSV